MQNTNFGLVGPRRRDGISLDLASFYTFGTAAGDFSLSANDDGSHVISLNLPDILQNCTTLCAYVTTL